MSLNKLSLSVLEKRRTNIVLFRVKRYRVITDSAVAVSVMQRGRFSVFSMIPISCWAKQGILLSGCHLETGLVGRMPPAFSVNESRNAGNVPGRRGDATPGGHLLCCEIDPHRSGFPRSSNQFILLSSFLWSSNQSAACCPLPSLCPAASESLRKLTSLYQKNGISQTAWA